MSFEWILVIAAGIAFNILIRLITPGFGSYRIGIDSMPTVPIVVGYLFGLSAGFWSGIIIGFSMILRSKRLEYLPLVVVANAMIGILSSFFTSWSLFPLAILMIFIYHLFGLVVINIVSELRPGFFIFVALNTITTLILVYFVSLIL